jgi:hypothetical protein
MIMYNERLKLIIMDEGTWYNWDYHKFHLVFVTEGEIIIIYLPSNTAEM